MTKNLVKPNIVKKYHVNILGIFCRFFGYLMVSLCLFGCYEGWEDPNNYGQGKDPLVAPPNNDKVIKKYAYILLTEVRLAAAAMTNTKCFSAKDLRDYKDAEWKERYAGLTADLAPLTEKLVTKEISVPVGDCTALATVLNEALNNQPWLPDSAPSSDPLNRLSLQIKAVFWEGEPSITAPTNVTKEDWAGFAALKGKGLPSKSVTYFVISNGGSGYFKQWSQALAKNVWISGTPINQVDPSGAGITARQALVKGDTTALVKWLLENAK